MLDVYVLPCQKDSRTGTNVFLPQGRVPCIRSDRAPQEVAADWLRRQGIVTSAQPKVYRLDSKITVLYQLQRSKITGWVNSASVLIQSQTYDKVTQGIVRSFLTIK